MLGFDTVYLHAKFDDSSFSRSRGLMMPTKIFKKSRNLTTTLLGIVAIHGLAPGL